MPLMKQDKNILISEMYGHLQILMDDDKNMRRRLDAIRSLNQGLSLCSTVDKMMRSQSKNTKILPSFS